MLKCVYQFINLRIHYDRCDVFKPVYFIYYMSKLNLVVFCMNLKSYCSVRHHGLLTAIKL